MSAASLRSFASSIGGRGGGENFVPSILGEQGGDVIAENR
jgi:hypothetical protein